MISAVEMEKSLRMPAASLYQGKEVGIDSSPEMIAYAAQSYPPSEYANLSFAYLDVRPLRFTAEFNVVFSNAVLHWVDDHWAFLRGAYLNEVRRPAP